MTFYKLSISSRRKLYLIFLNVAVILLFLSILQIQWVKIEITDFLGLTSHLPLSYWGGLILVIFIVLLIYFDEDIRDIGTLIFTLFVVGMFLFGIGTFAEENARAWSSYYPTGEVQTLIDQHNWNISSDYPLISYRSWPAFHFITAFLVYIPGSSLSDLAKYMPLFWVIVFTLFTFVIGKSLRGDLKFAFLTSLFALSSFWQIYYYFSPQAYAYLTVLNLMTIVTIFKSSARKYMLLIISFFVLIFSHLLYSIFFFSALVIQMLRQKQMYLIVVLSIILFSWYVYLSHLAFDSGISKVLFMFENTDVGLSSQLSKFTPGNTMKLFVNAFRFAYAGIYALLIGIIALYFLLGKINPKAKQKIKYWILWAIPFVFFVGVDYGSEGFERVYMFCLIPLICITILFFGDNKKIIPLLIIVFILLHIPAHYGTDAFLSTHTSELQGSSFFASKINITTPEEIEGTKYIYDSGGDRYIRFYNPLFVLADIISEKRLSLQKDDTDFIVNIDYIIIGEHDQNYERYYKIDRRIVYNAIERDNFNLIYNSGGLKIFPSVESTTKGRNYDIE